MADETVLRNSWNILFRGLCAAGGILAPVLAVSEPSLGQVAAAVAGGVLATAGGVWASIKAQDKADRDRARLSEASVLLRNHDLNLLVTEALKLTIQWAADERP